LGRDDLGGAIGEDNIEMDFTDTGYTGVKILNPCEIRESNNGEYQDL
jgi:hypothetical protein